MKVSIALWNGCLASSKICWPAQRARLSQLGMYSRGIAQFGPSRVFPSSTLYAWMTRSILGARESVAEKLMGAVTFRPMSSFLRIVSAYRSGKALASGVLKCVGEPVLGLWLHGTGTDTARVAHGIAVIATLFQLAF